VLTQEHQSLTKGQQGGFLPPLLLFYGVAGFLGFVCALGAPWFNWGFLACSVLGAAGLAVVVKHHRAEQARTGSVYGQSKAPLASPWYAFAPLVLIVLIAAWQIVSSILGYILG
jgi:hypothetical protein